MDKRVTLLTGQRADLDCETITCPRHNSGYDGYEIDCWDDQFFLPLARERTGVPDERKEKSREKKNLHRSVSRISKKRGEDSYPIRWVEIAQIASAIIGLANLIVTLIFLLAG